MHADQGANKLKSSEEASYTELQSVDQQADSDIEYYDLSVASVNKILSFNH